MLSALACLFLTIPNFIYFVSPLISFLLSVYSSPHRAVTILRENPFLFTRLSHSSSLVIEPGCLVNGIVLEYNIPLNGSVVDHE